MSSAADVDLAEQVGRRVRAARAGRGWTLDDLAGRSGVSRRMVVNVEQGVSNASIATLLRLSTALGISLSSLVEAPDASDLVVQRSGTHPVLWEGELGGRGALVASTEAPDVVELWDWTLGPLERYVSEEHSSGTRELLQVLSGTVTVTVAGESATLRVGDALSFRGDRPHSYSNASRRPARFSLSVFQPEVGA